MKIETNRFTFTINKDKLNQETLKRIMNDFYLAADRLILDGNRNKSPIDTSQLRKTTFIRLCGQLNEDAIAFPDNDVIIREMGKFARFRQSPESRLKQLILETCEEAKVHSDVCERIAYVLETEQGMTIANKLRLNDLKDIEGIVQLFLNLYSELTR